MSKPCLTIILAFVSILLVVTALFIDTRNSSIENATSKQRRTDTTSDFWRKEAGFAISLGLVLFVVLKTRGDKWGR